MVTYTPRQGWLATVNILIGSFGMLDTQNLATVISAYHVAKTLWAGCPTY